MEATVTPSQELPSAPRHGRVRGELPNAPLEGREPERHARGRVSDPPPSRSPHVSDRTTRSPAVDASHYRVVIIGAGFAGIGMAIRLFDRGERDFIVLEKARDVGG